MISLVESQSYATLNSISLGYKHILCFKHTKLKARQGRDKFRRVATSDGGGKRME